MVGDLNQTMPYSGWKRIVVVQESTVVDLREMLVVGSKTNSWAKSMTRALFIDNGGGVTQLLIFQLARTLSSFLRIACKTAMMSKLVADGLVWENFRSEVQWLGLWQAQLALGWVSQSLWWLGSHVVSMSRFGLEFPNLCPFFFFFLILFSYIYFKRKIKRKREKMGEE